MADVTDEVEDVVEVEIKEMETCMANHGFCQMAITSFMSFMTFHDSSGLIGTHRCHCCATRQFHPAPEDLLRGGKARGAEYWENFTLTETLGTDVRTPTTFGGGHSCFQCFQDIYSRFVVSSRI